jgi:hypothetical protein
MKVPYWSFSSLPLVVLAFLFASPATSAQNGVQVGPLVEYRSASADSIVGTPTRVPIWKRIQTTARACEPFLATTDSTSTGATPWSEVEGERDIECQPCQMDGLGHEFSQACCSGLSLVSRAELISIRQHGGPFVAGGNTLREARLAVRGESEPVCRECKSALIPPHSSDKDCHTYWEPFSTCTNRHPSCPAEGLTSAALLTALTFADAAMFDRFLASLGSAAANVTYSAERRAIQMTNCRGAIIIHVPVSPQQGALLTTLISRSAASINRSAASP